MTWLFLLAYWCSGFAGLIYEIAWTRLLTLYVGHTTAAASAVVAAFLGGLAVGAAAGGRISTNLSRRQSLLGYVGLELIVVAAAIALPYEVRLLMPVLQSVYANGDSRFLFPAIRLVSCLLMVFAPAAALGATFPLAIRWFARDADAARQTGVLYAVNTTGAAGGALLAGFVLTPSLGLAATTRVGIAASAAAALSVVAVALLSHTDAEPAGATAPRSRDKERTRLSKAREAAGQTVPRWLPAIVLGLSGVAALIHEIAWTRILSLVLGPTIYALSATLAAVIAGVALGSAIGTWISGRSRNRLAWLVAALLTAALSNSWTSSLAGGTVPHLVASYIAAAADSFERLLREATVLTAALIVPTAIGFGAVFPLALSLIPDSARASRDFAMAYAVNTIGAVAGSLLCGFVLIRASGLRGTLAIVSGCLLLAALVVAAAGRTSVVTKATGALGAAVAALMLLTGSWDGALLTSGAYLYAPYVPKDLDLDTQLKAGTLLYYRDGASATVSVKRLTGTLTLAVDGKVDASNRSDMLTQKLLAHVPLLLHQQPRTVAVVGLGSGVTVGAALRHPVDRVDVIEISPEVVEASRLFAADNQQALSDPRAHLIVGDGRSHLQLSARQYDVIVSEPSNPWIAGVAALFTREFFEAARARLAPGGIICQWAHTYNIANSDLRAIVATFTSVFPNGTLWLIGTDDVLLVASNGDRDDLEAHIGNIERNWQRNGVATDLASVAALEPFSVSSLLTAGPRQLATYTAGAPVLTDDRMALEFSGPRALHRGSAEDNGAALAALSTLSPPAEPNAPAAEGRAASSDPETAERWRRRGAMLFKADAFSASYRDYTRALSLDGASRAVLEGFARSAMLAGRAVEAVTLLKQQASSAPVTAAHLAAMSKLQASSGAGAEALATARQAAQLFPGDPDALEQLATLLADAGDTARLDETVARLRAAAPKSAAPLYFSGVSALMRGRIDEAVRYGEQAIAMDPAYAPVYDLVGAAYTKADRPADAKKAFEASLRFDAHDSAAYTNLGLLELAAGNRAAAANNFAEALSLAPGDATAREGLARSR